MPPIRIHLVPRHFMIYIVPFPILQVLVAHGLVKESPWLMLAAVGKREKGDATLFLTFMV